MSENCKLQPKLSIKLRSPCHRLVFRKSDDLLSLSLAYGLSSYDAAYLGLAIRLNLPIAAKDGALCAAAMAAGVGVFTP